MKPILLILCPLALLGQAPDHVLQYDASLEPVRFAATEIRRAYAERGERLVERPPAAAVTGRRRLVLTVTGENGGAWQSYSIRRRVDGSQTTWQVLAPDPVGAMYGGLDLAEAVRLGTLDQLADADRSPHVERRGIKFNAPLDLRTPSYSDNSTSAQANIPEMWSLDFWHEFLDTMARNRFNVLSLWNLHPFPSLVRVPEYPDVALHDVLRTRVPLDDTYTMSGNDMFRPMLMERVEVVRKMSIDDKIAFWRDVMRYAHQRGIEVYWFTWNIFTFGATGKYGITPDQDREDRRLLPRLCPRTGVDLPRSGWHRHHRGRADEEGFQQQRAVALADLRRGHPGRTETRPGTQSSPHPPLPHDGPGRDHPGVSGLPGPDRCQLQILHRAHVFQPETSVHRSGAALSESRAPDVAYGAG